MRSVAQPQINLAPCEPVVASLRAWLVEWLAWFCDALDALPPWAQRCPFVGEAARAAKAQLAADLHVMSRVLRLWLIANALARLKFTARARRVRTHKRPGFRVARRRAHLRRRFTGGALTGIHDGTLRQRVARFKALYDNLEPLIQRTLKRLREMWRAEVGAALVLVAARDLCVSVAAPAPRAAADTS